MGQRDPHVSEAEQSVGFDRQELADGKVTDNGITTTTLVSLSRIEWYPRLTKRLTGASSTAAMAARWRCAAAHQPSLVARDSHELRYSLTVT